MGELRAFTRAAARAVLRDEIPVLRDRHLRVVDLFHQRGVENLVNHEACVEVLSDERLRAEFTVKLKQFFETLDVVLPRPEGLPFAPDAKMLAFVYARPAIATRHADVLRLPLADALEGGTCPAGGKLLHRFGAHNATRKSPR